MSANQPGARIIFHIDMNSFYASVEIAHHPELKGKPLAIAGSVEDRRGIVVTSSYEARARGVKTTMPVWEARKHCPELILKPPDFPLYRQTSKQLFQLLRDYTDLVEKVSIDEGYMDVTRSLRDIHPIKLANIIQKKVFDTLSLPSSIGIAPNKFLAKMASDMKKPMGITVLRKRDMEKKLWPLEIGEMHGVGPKTEIKMKGLGIKTIGELAHYNEAVISERFGLQGGKLYKKANGYDDRLVDPEAEGTYKSIGHSTTLPEDTTSENVVRQTLNILANKIAEKLKRERVTAYQISLMVRYHNWKNITRNQTVKQPIQSKEEIVTIATRLFDHHWDGRPIRLLGITVTSLEKMGQASKQLDLFSYHTDLKKEPIVDLIHQLEERYGTGTIRAASNYHKGD